MKSIKFHVLVLFCVIHTYTLLAQTPDSTMSRIFAMDIEELMNTTVTIATKSDKSINETPSIVSVVTAEEIKDMGARDLEDILQTIPGFELIRRAGGYMGIGVRGVKDSRATSKILLMIDGTRINSVFYGNSLGFGYDIDINNISRVEIIRGPGSALYGRNAFSGVINIITKKEKKNQSSYIEGKLGTFNTKSLSGGYQFQHNKLKTSFAFQGIYSDMTDSKSYNDLGEIALWNIFRNNLNASANISYGKFSASVNYMNLKGAGGFFDNVLTKKSGTYNLTYANKINPKFSLSIKLYGHNEKYVEDLELVPPGKVSKYRKGVYYKPQLNEYLYGFESNFNYKLGVKHDLLFGVQTEFFGAKDVIITANADSIWKLYPDTIAGAGRNEQVLYKPGWFVNNGHNYYNMALFVQDEWHPLKKLGLTFGVRYDIDSQIGSIVNFRGGSVFELTPKTFIKLLYGQSYRAPSPSEQYQTLGFAFGNKDLKPEIIETYEISISQQIKSSTHKISIFRNHLKDMIYAASLTTVNSQNIYYNLGKNKSYGIEYENKIIINKNLSTYLNYSFTKSENTNTINGIDSTFNHPDVAPHKINGGITYLFLDKFRINLNGYYRSTMEKFLVLNKPVLDPVGDFTVLNATLQVINIIKGLNVSFSVYNLTDTKYYSQDNQRPLQPSQPGRQINAGISYTF